MIIFGRNRRKHKARLHTALKNYVGTHHKVDEMAGLAMQAIRCYRAVWKSKSHDSTARRSGHLDPPKAMKHVTSVSLRVRVTLNERRGAKNVKISLRKTSCMHRRASCSFMIGNNSTDWKPPATLHQPAWFMGKPICLSHPPQHPITTKPKPKVSISIHNPKQLCMRCI